jgi:hypothetical protein
MPRIRRLLFGRAGSVGLALTMWDLWRRLPPQQRRWMLSQARRHGPSLARRAYYASRRPKKR